MFQRTTAVNKLLAMKARKKVVQGGTWAGKTHGIIPIIHDRISKSKKKITATVVAESIPAVKQGAVTIFKDIMEETGRFVESRWLGNPMEYTYHNKCKIEFRAYDTVGKAKAAGKREILFLNECDNIPYDIADALITRSNEVWFDFNPSNEFWVHTEILTEPDAEFLNLTYLDNEACPPHVLEELDIKMRKAFYNPHGDWNDLKNIKSDYWANWCRVYVRGEIGSLQGVVFTNWKTIDNIPTEARKLGRGIDFGYTNDPTTIVDVYKYNEKRILDLICYQKGLSNAQIAKYITDKLPTYCDSAEPKSIDELKLSKYLSKSITSPAVIVSKFGMKPNSLPSTINL